MSLHGQNATEWMAGVPGTSLPSQQLQNPETELQPPQKSSFHPLLLIRWTKGTFTGAHRKLKCCLMSIVRYLNQKRMAERETCNHSTPNVAQNSQGILSTVRCMHLYPHVAYWGFKLHKEGKPPGSVLSRALSHEKAPHIFTRMNQRPQQNSTCTEIILEKMSQVAFTECPLLALSLARLYSGHNACFQ